MVKIGEKVLQYLWRMAKEGLHYKRLGEGDHGPDHQQHCERRRDAVAHAVETQRLLEAICYQALSRNVLKTALC